MYKKLRSRQRRNPFKPIKVLPYKLQKYSAIAGIAGTLLTLILSVLAISISIENRNISTKIEHMDTLLKKQDSLILILGEQSSKQNQINDHLSSLYTLFFDANGKLSEQINTANVQYDFFQQSSRPNIVHISTKIEQSNNGSYVIKIKFQNTGGRDARGVHFSNAFYKKVNGKYSLIFQEEEDPSTLVSFIAKGDAKEYIMYLSKDDVESLSNCFSYYKIDFFDQHYQSKHSNSFFFIKDLLKMEILLILCLIILSLELCKNILILLGNKSKILGII